MEAEFIANIGMVYGFYRQESRIEYSPADKPAEQSGFLYGGAI